MVQGKASVAMRRGVERAKVMLATGLSVAQAFVTCVLVVGLAACGQKGPLMLPKATAGTAPASSPASAP